MSRADWAALIVFGLLIGITATGLLAGWFNIK